MAISLLNLNDLNGSNGFAIPGITPDDHLGMAVEITGDLNGDGIEDLIISSPDGGNPSSSNYSLYYSDRRGKAYVIFGTRAGFNPNFNLKNLNGNNGFSVTGLQEDDSLGTAIAIGDINGDGIDDLALGAPYAGGRLNKYGYDYSEGRGRTYLIFGKSNGFNPQVDLNSLSSSQGLSLGGIDAQDNLGMAITSLGDINGDGIDDLAVSATGAGNTITNNNGYGYSDRRGETYVIFGRQNIASGVNLALLDGTNGFIVKGKDRGNSLGYSLSNGGDLNGDGIDDLVLGTPAAGEVLNSPYAQGDSDRRGETYVIFGRRNGFSSRFNVSDLNGNNGFTVSGIKTADNLGSAVTNTGDINGDGIDDLILGASSASQSGAYTFEGGVYVVFGRQGGFGAKFDLNNLNGTNGFKIPGVDFHNGLGNAVSVADFNGDGIEDLFLSASTAGANLTDANGYSYNDRRGKVYILFGNQNFDAQINLNNLGHTEGWEIQGSDRDDLFGTAISSGNLNGDNFADLIIGAPGVDLTGEYTKEGKAYVIFGSSGKDDGIIRGTNGNDSNLNGTPSNDEIFALDGNDTVNGLNGNDTIYGNNGNDLLRGQNNDDRIDGNRGNDTLRGDDDNDTLYGNEQSDRLIGNFGNDFLDGGKDQDTLFGNQNDDTLNGDYGNDSLNGGSGNDLLMGGNDLDLMDGSSGNDSLSGGDGQDTLTGGTGLDSLNGDGSGDRLNGSIGDDTLNGGVGNDTLNGGLGNDLLNGNEDNDILDGTNSPDSKYGVNELDTLIGGTGTDIFTLGDDGQVYYDDKNTFSKGINDFARISGVNVTQDIVKLQGRPHQYSLNLYQNGSSTYNAEIIYNPGDYVLGELIGVLENVSANLSISDPLFSII